MVLWWIGNVILLVVVLPVVIFLLNRVLAALERIRGATDHILAGGVALVGELDGLPEALTVTDGVQDVAQLTSTVPERLTSVNASLKPVRDFCETV